MTFLCDQLGLNARSIEDILLYDKALTAHPDDPAQAPIAALHDSAAAAVAAWGAAALELAAAAPEPEPAAPPLTPEQPLDRAPSAESSTDEGAPPPPQQQQGRPVLARLATIE